MAHSMAQRGSAADEDHSQLDSHPCQKLCSVKTNIIAAMKHTLCWLQVEGTPRGTHIIESVKTIRCLFYMNTCCQ